MNERPILFSAEMVRAIVEGRKTQTRRIISRLSDEPDSWASVNCDGHGGWIAWSFPTTDEETRRAYPGGGGFLCPYGKPGDRLWARESMWLSSCGGYFARQCYDPGRYPTSYDVLARDGSGIWRNSAWSNKGRRLKSGRQTKEFSLSWRDDNGKLLDAEFRRRWPSIYMPRWASRLTLEVTDIRVERIRDITWEDAIKEGVISQIDAIKHPKWLPIDRFAMLWNDINGHPKPIYERVGGRLVIVRYESYPWEEGTYTTTYRGKPHHVYGNPWVWAVEFRKPANG